MLCMDSVFGRSLAPWSADAPRPLRELPNPSWSSPNPLKTGQDNKRIELTRPNRDGAYQPHRD